MATRIVRRNSEEGIFFSDAAPPTVTVTVAATVLVGSSEPVLDVMLELSGVEDVPVCLELAPLAVPDTVTSELALAIVDPDSTTAEPDSMTVDPETIRVEPYSRVVPCGLAVETPVPVCLLVSSPVESVAVGGGVLEAVPGLPL